MLIEGLLDDHEDLLQSDVSVELHYRVARCAHQLDDTEGAARHAAVALALAPLIAPTCSCAPHSPPDGNF